MRVLCVAEKNSIARAVADLLSSGSASKRTSPARFCPNFDFPFRLRTPRDVHAQVTVTSVQGHLLDSDFVRGNGWRQVAPEHLFDAGILRGCNLSGKDKEMENVKRNLEQEARHADLLVIWTDCDREGEAIGMDVANVCRAVNPRLVVKRAKFSVIQHREINQAMHNLVEIDHRQAAAVAVRNELDLRIGAALTRFLTMRFQSRFKALDGKMLSYGSCQFPTLGFVVDAYRKIARFSPEPFWKISASVLRPLHQHAGAAGDDVHQQQQQQHSPPQPGQEAQRCNFLWDRGSLFDELFCLALYEPCVLNPEATVTQVVAKPKSKWKPYPMTTVDLAKMGTTSLRMPSDQVMAVAEKLYQQGFVSYPRTETNEFDPAVDLRALVALQMGDPGWGGYVTDAMLGARNLFSAPRRGNKNDKAHPPIHPTRAAPHLTGNERRVYELITRRFLACCNRDAEGRGTKVSIQIAGEGFTTTGLVIHARNYLDIYPYDLWSAQEVPDFAVGERFVPDTLEMTQGETSPPSLLTEAQLIGLMETHGIGTDATIPDHIKKVIERDYVLRQGGGNGGGAGASRGRGRGRGLGCGGGRGGGGMGHADNGDGHDDDGGAARAGGSQAVMCPTTLGIALVDGMDAVTQQSLAKPHLRASLEANLVAISEGRARPEVVVAAAIREFRRVYRRTVVRAYAIETRLAENLGADPSNQPPNAGPGPGNGGFGGGNGGGFGGGGGGGRDNGPPPPRPFLPLPPPGPHGNSGTLGGGYAPFIQPPPQYGAPGGNNRGDISFLQNQFERRDEPYAPPVRKCRCQMVAVIKTVSKGGPTKGEQFWTCPAVSQTAKCSYFEWATEEESAREAAADARQDARSFGPATRGGRGGGRGSGIRAARGSSRAGKRGGGTGSRARGASRGRGRGRGRGGRGGGATSYQD
ncbi:DNA topoisomerase [Blastocladiella britannica]|nr:DNA topoisomerase [Blastocladiella britannica]